MVVNGTVAWRGARRDAIWARQLAFLVRAVPVPLVHEPDGLTGRPTTAVGRRCAGSTPLKTKGHCSTMYIGLASRGEARHFPKFFIYGNPPGPYNITNQGQLSLRTSFSRFAATRSSVMYRPS